MAGNMHLSLLPIRPRQIGLLSLKRAETEVKGKQRNPGVTVFPILALPLRQVNSVLCAC